MKNYKKYCDDELIKFFRNGDELALDILFKNYKGFIYYICNKYYLKDGEKEDLFQEATIGFFEAVRDYQPSCGKKFRNFAFLCVTRELDSCIKKSNRKKHQILNDAIPIYSFSEYEEERLGITPNIYCDKVLEDTSQNPEEMIIEKESIRELLKKINAMLSDLERQVLKLRIKGLSYKEITKILNLQTKAVDNAIQRIRKKIDKQIFLFRSA